MSAAWHLDRIAVVLERRGWSVVRLYQRDEDHGPLLRVHPPEVRVFGETVMVTPCGDGQLWFQSSEFRLLAPVRHPETAAAQLIAIMTPYTTVSGVGDAGAGGHRRSRRGLVRWLLMRCQRRA